MTDNLANMIFTGQEENTNVSGEMLSVDKVETTENIGVTATLVEEPVETVAPVDVLDFTNINFYEWFEKYSSDLMNVRHVKMSCRGLDVNETMAFLIPHPDGGVLGGKDAVTNEEVSIPRQKLIIKEYADKHLLPDMHPLNIKFFSNDNFIVDYLTPDQSIYLSIYFRKKQAFYVFSKMITDKLIPYHIAKYDIAKKGGNFEACNIVENVFDAVLTNQQKESLGILYNQISKVVVNMATKKDVLDWMVERKASVMDIHHLLVIDNFIITLMSM